MANRNMQENKQTENTMTKVIDGKTYKVQVHFSETSKIKWRPGSRYLVIKN